MLTKQRSLTGPLGPGLIGEMSQWLQALGAEFNFSPEDQYRIDLCGEEIVTNIVKYSDPQYANQPVEVRAVIEPQRARLIFIDPAGPFDPFSRPPPAAVTTLEDFAIGGQGVHLCGNSLTRTAMSDATFGTGSNRFCADPRDDEALAARRHADGRHCQPAR